MANPLRNEGGLRLSAHAEYSSAMASALSLLLIVSATFHRMAIQSLNVSNSTATLFIVLSHTISPYLAVDRSVCLSSTTFLMRFPFKVSKALCQGAFRTGQKTTSEAGQRADLFEPPSHIFSGEFTFRIRLWLFFWLCGRHIVAIMWPISSAHRPWSALLTLARHDKTLSIWFIWYIAHYTSSDGSRASRQKSSVLILKSSYTKYHVKLLQIQNVLQRHLSSGIPKSPNFLLIGFPNGRLF